MSEIVLAEFTGKSEGKVFETTSEETAKKEGIFHEEKKYGAAAVALGRNMILKALEEELKEMKEGESKQVSLTPEKAFGERKPELVGIVPLKEFKARKIQPVPGLIVNLNDRIGKVQSISGGRVRVDFNNDLAGKTVEYELKLVKRVEDKKEQVQALAERLLSVKGIKTELVGSEAIIELPLLNFEKISALKQQAAQELMQDIEGIEKVSFKETVKKAVKQN